jgi:predicted ATPase
VLHQIVTRTDGIPLFVEELTKMILESGLLREEVNRYILTGAFSSVGIPATLQDSLRARFDRLGPAKEVAQLAATVGREFPYELLRAVSSSNETALQNALSQLVEAEVLSRKKLQSQELYIFKHALIQEVAYQSLLKSTRRQYHQQTAQVLEERFPEIAETQPELLAHHYTEAGLIAQAIPYWQQAGQRAIQRSANTEAISHLSKGLELLKSLPDTPERIQHELMLQITLGAPLMMTKGYADPEVERAYSRARTLCELIGETPQLFPVLFGLWLFDSVRAEHKTAHELAEQLLNLAQSTQASALLLEAHTALGNTLLFVGELVPARIHLEQGIVLYDPHQHHSHAFLYGQDPGVVCRSYKSFTLWLLGYPDQASRQSYEALALARELSHPFSQAFALNFVTNIHWFRREVHATREQADTLCALSSEQGFPLPLGTGMILQGWALAEQGQGDEGLKQIRQGLAVWKATGAERFFWPCLLAPLAEAYGRKKEPEEGLTVVAEALAIVNTTRESFYEAELYRLKGELTLAQGIIQGLVSSLEKEVEECFWKALEIARWQQAKSWELRAAMSLGRLWLRQGKRAEARRMLTEIYGWFTEGFDTGDLKEAKALLEGLS